MGAGPRSIRVGARRGWGGVRVRASRLGPRPRRRASCRASTPPRGVRVRLFLRYTTAVRGRPGPGPRRPLPAVRRRRARRVRLNRVPKIPSTILLFPRVPGAFTSRFAPAARRTRSGTTRYDGRVHRGRPARPAAGIESVRSGTMIRDSATACNTLGETRRCAHAHARDAGSSVNTVTLLTAPLRWTRWHFDFPVPPSSAPRPNSRPYAVRRVVLGVCALLTRARPADARARQLATTAAHSASQDNHGRRALPHALKPAIGLLAHPSCRRRSPRPAAPTLHPCNGSVVTGAS